VFSQASAAFDDGDEEVQCGAKEEWAQARQEPANTPADGAIQGSMNFCISQWIRW
jgi:hypothetical protein